MCLQPRDDLCTYVLLGIDLQRPGYTNKVLVVQETILKFGVIKLIVLITNVKSSSMTKAGTAMGRT